jgi:hypothetical protein
MSTWIKILDRYQHHRGRCARGAIGGFVGMFAVLVHGLHWF